MVVNVLDRRAMIRDARKRPDGRIEVVAVPLEVGRPRIKAVLTEDEYRARVTTLEISKPPGMSRREAVAEALQRR